MVVEINQSAFRHGVTDEDIHQALATVVFDGLLPQYANKFLLIGFDRNSNLIEVMYNIRKDGSYNVFHAMKCRKEFYRYVEESNYYV
jgi:hypothetical protein